jgi:DNA segregation ATPase FtsK/SpoIIIE, S-DNA-T family
MPRRSSSRSVNSQLQDFDNASADALHEFSSQHEFSPQSDFEGETTPFDAPSNEYPPEYSYEETHSNRRTRSMNSDDANEFASPRTLATRPLGAARPLGRAQLRDAARRAAGNSDETGDLYDDAPQLRPNRMNHRNGPAERENTRTLPREVSPRETKNSRARKTAEPSKTPPRALAYEVAGVLCFAFGALLLINALRQAEGALPTFTIGALRWLFGLGSVTIPATLCVLGVLLLARRHHLNLRAFARGATASTLVLLTALHLRVPRGQELAPENARVLFDNGGYAGGFFAWILRAAMGEVGAIIFLVAGSLLAVLFWTEMSLARVGARVRDFVQHGYGRTVETFQNEDGDWVPAHASTHLAPRLTLRERIFGRSRHALPAAETTPLPVEKPSRPKKRSPFMPVDELLSESSPAQSATPEAELNAPQESSTQKETPTEIEAPRIEIVDAPPPESVVSEANASTQLPDIPQGNRNLVQTSYGLVLEDDLTPTELLEAQAQASATGGEEVAPPRPEKPRRSFGDGPLMPPYFDEAVMALDPPVAADLAGVEDDIRNGVKSVQDTLASFKIDARVTDVKRGPVITRYEVQPAPGVRVATIANLDRDMARALSAIAVRIEAPVPGKDVVGIEVPNKKVHLVRMRDVLERHDFLSTQSKLSFVLGKDIAGQPKWADLTKMPHMLIAGATNSGKSVCLNSIIASILVRATPDEVKFSLIDPKRVELTLYRGIPHLLHPVVVEPKDAVKALRGAIMEMDKRYRAFAQRGVRNIASYNAKLEEGEKPLPYIVIVIDELADLMMTAAAEFEKLICRLAQLARATGIHLIVATQRPSVNVITGVIKANIPSRIAFAVASQVDSRTILDSVGAERLIGSGDMLFDANNGGKATRIQGAFLSEEEVNRVVDVVKECYFGEEFDYEMNLDDMEDETPLDDDRGSGGKSEKRDELFDDILEFVLRNTEMSASLIQRKFEIGYPRAGRIVDQLERAGVLSPPDGSKPRKVLGPPRSSND